MVLHTFIFILLLSMSGCVNITVSVPLEGYRLQVIYSTSGIRT